VEDGNKVLIFFGIILLIIGLVASFYHEPVIGITTCPYQNVGMVLDASGIVSVAIGLLYPSRWLD
jgi:hypothetical protein